MYPEATLEMLMTPALLRKIKPARAKQTMIPIADNQTINPTKHLRVYMKIKETATAIPKPHRIHCQLFYTSLMKAVRPLVDR